MDEDLGNIKIVPITQSHIESFHACLDSVARERVYLAIVEASPLEAVRAFVNDGIEKGYPKVVAVTPDNRVVGWCDITPHPREGFRHSGRLGMGVHRDFRGRGLGTKLMDAALTQAREIGLEQVELDVYASNERAIRLYTKFGFEVEGVKKRARKRDGQYDDMVMMALPIDGER